MESLNRREESCTVEKDVERSSCAFPCFLSVRCYVFAVFSQTSLLSSAPLSPADTMPLALEADNNIGVGQLARHPESAARGDCVCTRFKKGWGAGPMVRGSFSPSVADLHHHHRLTWPVLFLPPFFSLRLFFSLSTSIFHYSFSRLFSSSRVSDAVSCLVCGRPSSRWFFKWFAIQTPRISRRFIAFYLVVHHDRNRDTHSSFQVYTL